MQPHTTAIIVILAVAALLAGASSVAAADLRMQVFPGFDGHCKRGCWAPVTVVVTNYGPDTEGKLSIETRGDGRLTAFTREIDVPQNSKLAYSLCVLVEGLDGDEIAVSLRRGGRRRLVDRAALKQHGQRDKLVLAASRDTDGLQAAGGQKVPVLPLPAIVPGAAGEPYYGYYYEEKPAFTDSLVAPEDSADVVVAPVKVPTAWATGGTGLPQTALAYDAVDAVLLTDFPAARLSEQEQSALRRWVSRGGSLVVTCGGSLEDLRGPLMEDLLPVQVAAEKPLATARSLVARYGTWMPPVGEFLAASGPLQHGEVLAGSRSFPLLAARDYGNGRVYYLALDPRKQPLRSWGPGVRRFWREVLTHPRRLIPSGSRPSYTAMWGYEAPAAAVTEIPQMEAPSFAIVGLFLFLYVVCLVPVNYLVLRRLDKREWAWVTTPAIVLVFSFGAYLSGRLLKGGQIIYHEASVATTVSASHSAYLDTFAGIFSPSRASYTVQLPPPSAGAVERLVNPGGRSQLEVRQDEAVTLPDVQINMWAMRVFQVAGDLDMGEGIRATMRIQGGKIEGTIHNGTPYDFSKAQALRRGAAHRIGNLRRGRSAEFSLPVAPKGDVTGWVRPAGSPDSGSSGKAADAMLFDLEDKILGPGRPLHMGLGRSEILLVAWMEDAPGPDISFQPGRARPVEGTLLLAAIPVELTEAKFDVPHGLTTARVVESSFDSLDAGYASDRGMPKGYMVAEVDLPVSGWDLRFSAVKVYFSYKGKGGLRFAARDWTGGGWQELPVSPGSRNNLRLPQPQRFVRLPEGKLQFRIENTNTKNPPTIGDLSVSCQGWHAGSGEESE